MEHTVATSNSSQPARTKSQIQADLAATRQRLAGSVETRSTRSTPTG